MSAVHDHSRRTLTIASPPPLTLYVHLPWCLKKCPYCDFNSHEWRAVDALPEARYLEAACAAANAAVHCSR